MLAIAAIAGVIVYLVVKYVSGGLKLHSIVKDTRKLQGQTTALTVENSELPALTNGAQYSYSMWIYLPNFTPADGPAVLLARGATLSAGAPSGLARTGETLPSPMVLLDGGSNRLVVAVATTAREGEVKLQDLVDKRAGSRAVVSTIEYVPLQRWVHVAFTVNDALLTTYVDGDLYTVENVTDAPAPSGGKRLMFSPSTGAITVPSARPSATATSASSEGMPQGFLGRVQFFNYALTHRDVVRLSSSGPKGLGALGLNRYGLRSPIYRRSPADDATTL